MNNETRNGLLISQFPESVTSYNYLGFGWYWVNGKTFFRVETSPLLLASHMLASQYPELQDALERERVLLKALKLACGVIMEYNPHHVMSDPETYIELAEAKR